MDHDPRCCADTDAGRDAGRDADPAAATRRIDWLAAQVELDECDGYVVLCVDPQTGEVDAHGPFPGLEALETAQSLRDTLDREGLDDVVVRVVRWHQDRPGHAA
jgi:hypothetical protein